LDGGQKIKKYVLRTTLDTINVWKAKYSKNSSPFTDIINGVSKYAAIVDKEVWMFDIDATNSGDIFTAVTIAKNYFKISAKELIGEVYVKISMLNVKMTWNYKHWYVQTKRFTQKYVLH
jgi:hypothetical protein